MKILCIEDIKYLDTTLTTENYWLGTRNKYRYLRINKAEKSHINEVSQSRNITYPKE